MNENRSANELPALRTRRRKNPTHAPRIDGYRWNLSQIADALNMHRNTVRKYLYAADLEPDGRIHNAPVWELSRAVPVLFDHPPRSPKEHTHE